MASAVPPLPAREALAELLQTVVAGGQAYACGGPLPPQIKPVLPLVFLRGVGSGAAPLSLPLDAAQHAAVIAACSRSGVGKATSDEPVVDLSVRKSWELLPDQFDIVNNDAWRAGVLSPLLNVIKRNLECEEWVVGAEIYKLLVYEEGSFFSKHRDKCVGRGEGRDRRHPPLPTHPTPTPRSERIVSMFGTLVIQLPSVYTGASLRVHSPTAPDKNVVFDFSSAGAARPPPDAVARMSVAELKALLKTLPRVDVPPAVEKADLVAAVESALSLSALRYSAFYADCYHDVSPLLTGTRVCLVYNLTAKSPPKAARLPREYRADPILVAPTLPQQPEVGLVSRIANELRRWETETDAAYPNYIVTPEIARANYVQEGTVVLHRVPVKLVAVLSHMYTPSSLRGLHSLKGRDRVVGRLLYDAVNCRHTARELTLAEAAAVKLPAAACLQGAPAAAHLGCLDVDDPRVGVAERVLTQAAQPTAAPPEFDIFLSFVAVWDSGEGTPTPSFFTFGPMIPFEPGTATPDAIASAVDMRALRTQLDAGYAGLFGGESQLVVGSGDEWEEYVPNDNWGGVGDIQPTKHCMRIEKDELLLFFKEARLQIFQEVKSSFSEVAIESSPEEVEIFGNGPVCE